ncbi:MAG: hypothetical protein HC860_00630 [Alkalinema sp. RU_4_3]|nr:hypothetical protein [Alkalinema sp. RU_4_3]
MKRSPILALLPLLAITATPAPAQAGDGCTYQLGQSSTGVATELNLCSIRRIHKTFNVDFTYTLGGESIPARANCRSNNWVTFPENTTHTPKSKATDDMLKILCTAPVDGNGDSVLAVIFNPPTNIRKTPNGKVICQITDLRVISISGGPSNGWYRTGLCGYDYIHKSQLRFN